MQYVQEATPGSFWSNRSKDGKLFKNIGSSKPVTMPFCAFLSFFVDFVWTRCCRLFTSQKKRKRFGQIWSRQCNAAKVLQDLQEGKDLCTSQMDHVFWIGHSTILLCLKNKTNILFDPIFSERCSPFSFIGPKRCFPPGTTVEHLPPIHIVAISHNHYDHLDENSIHDIYNRNPSVIFVVPLRLDNHLMEWGIPKSSILAMNWQDEIVLKDVAIACTPAQHYGRRGLFDTHQVLWCGWCIGYQTNRTSDSTVSASQEKKREICVTSSPSSPALPVPSSRPRQKTFDWSKAKVFYFPGDTAFNKDVFDLIHAQFDHMDMAAIPVGAYKPRGVLSKYHIDPASAAPIFKILNVKKAFGVHWATFELGNESIDEPPNDLKVALEVENIDTNAFVLIPIGEHISF